MLGLGEEFDLPDTAPTGFYIVAFDGDSAAAAMRINLALDRVDVLDRCEVEVFTPDEGPQLTQKALRGNAIAGDRARLDQGCAFPILPDAFVVGERRRDRYRERRGCRIGAKPEIGTEHIPITGAFLQNAHQIARQADKEGLHAVARGHPQRVPVIQKDQIDIARIIELIAAEFSHAQHDQPALPLRLTRIQEGDEPFAGRLAQQVTQRCAQGRLREAAESCRLLLERPGTDKFRHRGDKCDATLGDSQARHHGRRLFAKICGPFDTSGDLGEERVGTFLEEAGQQGPFFDCDAAQKGAVAEHRRKQTFAGVRRTPGSGEIGGGIAFRQREGLTPGIEPEGESAGVGRLGQSVTIGGDVR